jgi:hypothetical protein
MDHRQAPVDFGARASRTPVIQVTRRLTDIPVHYMRGDATNSLCTMKLTPTKASARRHHFSLDDGWFVATAVLVLIAIFLFTLLAAGLELQWGVIPDDTWILE